MIIGLESWKNTRDDARNEKAADAQLAREQVADLIGIDVS